MSHLFIFLGIYLLLGASFWLSYPLIRSKINKQERHKLIFILHLIFGLILLTGVPVYFYLSGIINTWLVAVLGLVMGIIAVLHHLSILKNGDPWTGIIEPKGLKVSRGHGPISHISFAFLYAIYGLFILFYLKPQANLFSEKLTLLGSIILIESMSFIGMLEGVRMCYHKKL